MVGWFDDMMKVGFPYFSKSCTKLKILKFLKGKNGEIFDLFRDVSCTFDFERFQIAHQGVV